MTTTTPPLPAGTSTTGGPPPGGVRDAAAGAKAKLSRPWASLTALVIAVLWTIPTFGLFVTSIRQPGDVRRSGWWTALSNPDFTIDNYRTVLSSTSGTGLGQAFLNSFIITLPAVVIPICLASLAAYAFAWIDFKGKNFLFVAIFAMQIVPIQVALLPLLRLYVDGGLAGSNWTLWISHTIFALPLAIFLLHNFMKEIPRELIEAARMDGAGHVQIFFQVLMPLLTPALAAFGIFQFLWVWNDLLVSLTFAAPANQPITVAIANLAGTRGNAWHLLSAGAFLMIIVPVAVFIGLQRFFVRGLLAGGLKG